MTLQMPALPDPVRVTVNPATTVLLVLVHRVIQKIHSVS
jgi:hypothetical protein